MQAVFSGPELCRRQAHEVVALLKSGEISPRDCLDAAFARIAEVEPAINAMPTICPERAYDAAMALMSSDSGEGPWLAGLPLAIKDLNMVCGVRTTFGTMGFSDFVPDISDLLVTRLETRGGIVVGKTNTPEMGAGGNTFNDVFGPTLNPWDTQLNAGGSSGGAAASLPPAKSGSATVPTMAAAFARQPAIAALSAYDPAPDACHPPDRPDSPPKACRARWHDPFGTARCSLTPCRDSRQRSRSRIRDRRKEHSRML